MNDKLKRHFFLKNELKRRLLRALLKSRLIPTIRRYQASYYLATLPHITSSTFYVNRCVKSGRIWSVHKSTGYNRFILREEIMKSNLPGYKRAS